MGGAKAGDAAAGLRKGRGAGTVRVRHPADGLEAGVEHDVGRRVGRRAQAAFRDFPGQVEHDHFVGRQVRVRHAAGLDDNQALAAIDAADIAPRQLGQPFPAQRPVGLADFLA